MTVELRVNKPNSKWAVGTWIEERQMWVGDFYKTKRDAMQRLDALQTLLANQGKSSQAHIYDAKGSHKECIMIISRKDTA